MTWAPGEYLPHRWCLDRITPKSPKGIRRCNMRRRWEAAEGFGVWDAYGSICHASRIGPAT